ncbi:Zinc finger CCCH domain-containing protein 32 [Acorus calamus]|uniref:Zinc finger CCCH domain-containing protein 32 n=1 Tax=Acorus calamus TaxID=4465 RepID=A0AAV9E0J1_ACOCL|nr:Zinc finger CCCH domain-containing protein 32 [Acorus calamus]
MAVSATSVEDEIQKRNTDCVYFLASPLTCKKGSECEYRHSELARLNPRDCWYWLAGNCINPACSFRHPPLEGLSESSHPVQPTVTEKMNVPCYFFFNAYCNKGNLCQFLHGPPTITVPPQKSLHSASGLQADHPPDNKASTGSDTGSASVEVPTNFFEGTSKASAAPTNDIVVSERSPSLQPSIPECDEASMGKLLENPPEYTDGGESPEQASDPGEREERWESSPGFDVLVDDGSDQLPYDEERDYPLDGKHHLFPYEYKEMVGYEDQMDKMLYDHSMYGSYDHVDDVYIPDHVHGERMLSTEPRERRRFPSRREIVINDHDDGLDLRDQLRKQRRNGQGPPCRRRDGERSVRHGREIHRRLVSEVGMNVISSLHSESDHSGFNGGVGRRRWSGRLQRSRSRSRQRQRERERERRRQMRRSPRLTSEIANERRPIQADAGFSGPKTLAQIKEEKRAAEAARDGGPKPASNDNGESVVKPLMEDFDGDFDYVDDDLFDDEEDGGLAKRILSEA